jgi:hypothetical protein
MGITDKVAQLLEAEIEKKTHERLCEVVEKVSRLYAVPLKIARRDLLGDTYCMGVWKEGKLCTHKTVKDGYCARHVNDSRPHKPIEMKEAVRHTHVYPSPLKEGCPACALLRKKRDCNEFRDLSTIM